MYVQEEVTSERNQEPSDGTQYVKYYAIFNPFVIDQWVRLRKNVILFFNLQQRLLVYQIMNVATTIIIREDPCRGRGSTTSSALFEIDQEGGCMDGTF